MKYHSDRETTTLSTIEHLKKCLGCHFDTHIAKNVPPENCDSMSINCLSLKTKYLQTTDVQTFQTLFPKKKTLKRTEQKNQMTGKEK